MSPVRFHFVCCYFIILNVTLFCIVLHSVVVSFLSFAHSASFIEHLFCAGAIAVNETKEPDPYRADVLHEMSWAWNR